MHEMTAASVPTVLQHKVKATYEHLWLFGGNPDGMLRDPVLSLDLRRRLALSLYGPALRRVPMFSDVKSMFLKCLCQKIEVRLYTPGDMLVLIGEVGSELFIIQQGSVEPVDEDGNPIRDIVMSEGSFFGEICFLHPGTRRTASIRCVEFCRAMVLTIEAFKELNMEDVLDTIRDEGRDARKTYVMVAHGGPITSPASGAQEQLASERGRTGHATSAGTADESNKGSHLQSILGRPRSPPNQGQVRRSQSGSERRECHRVEEAEHRWSSWSTSHAPRRLSPCLLDMALHEPPEGRWWSRTRSSLGGGGLASGQKEEKVDLLQVAPQQQQ